MQIVFLLCLFSAPVCSGLKVLVRLHDGKITEEILEADSEKDIITIEFKQGDGTLITFLSDFKRVSCSKKSATFNLTRSGRAKNKERLMQN